MLELTDDSGGNLVTVRDLHFARGTKRIFDGVDLDIKRGKVTALMGPSGTGKTTLLRLITGQLRPDRGTALVGGHKVAALPHAKLYELRKSMGMLFQNGALLTDLTVFENVAFPVREHTTLTESLIRRLVLMKLHAVGLRNTWDMMPAELSGGMARRVALARAIVMDPELILYDEPFVGLDPISMGVVARLIRLINDTLGLTSIVVSHDVPEVSSVSDVIYLLSNGKVMAYGRPEDLRDNPSPWAQQFIRGLPDGPVPFHYPGRDYRSHLLGLESA